MGAPMPDMEPVENASAEALLDSLKTIGPGERRKHASVFNYWLSIRGNRDFPPIRDLDPLEISDAGPWSLLLEMIGGGEDAVVKHLGQAIRDEVEVERIADAAAPSLLHCIHAKLPIVAACRQAYAFEDRFEGDNGAVRCWVTLLPFSANGTWIDFVYGYVSLDSPGAEETAPAPVAEELPEAPPEPEICEEAEEEAEEAIGDDEPEVAEVEPEPFTVPLARLDEDFDEAEALAEPEPILEPEPEPAADVAETAHQDEPEPAVEAEYASEFDEEPQQKPGFAKLMESLGGFYGKVVQSGPELPPEAFVEDEPMDQLPDAQPEPITESAYAVESPLQNKLSDVRLLAEEARQAQVRSNQALYEGLSAAYDFALDAEDAPEDYLRLVEAQGLKIQLRSPMKPVVKLAFDGMCDEPTIKQLEAVLGWALKQDLPRGSLAARIEAEGGIGAILNSQAA